MDKITKIVIWIIIIILIVGGIWYGLTRRPKEQGTIKVGYVSALSGHASAWGQSIQKGFDFAIEEINSKGGINGRKIEVVYEDDVCDPTIAISAFTKVIDMDKVKIITGTICSSVAMSVASKTQADRVFYLPSFATHPDIPKQGDLVFRIWPSDVYEGKEVGKYAVNNLKLKNFSAIYLNDNPNGIAIKDAFKETVEQNGGTVMSQEGVSSTEKDYRTILTKLIKDNPDGIYIAISTETTPLAVNQARELGYQGAIFLYGGSVLAEGVIDKIEIKENTYYPAPVVIKETSFWNDYKQKTGEDADQFIALGYDSVKLIEYGLDICGENNDCIRDELLKLNDFQTTRGRISFDKDGDVQGIQYEIKGI